MLQRIIDYIEYIYITTFIQSFEQNYEENILLLNYDLHHTTIHLLFFLITESNLLF